MREFLAFYDNRGEYSGIFHLNLPGNPKTSLTTAMMVRQNGVVESLHCDHPTGKQVPRSRPEFDPAEHRRRPVLLTDVADDLLSPGTFTAADDGYFNEHGRYLDVCRRVRVGPSVVATFENAQTLGFRIRELRAYAKLTGDASSFKQLEWYEDAIPTGDRLVASLHVRDRMRGTDVTATAEAVAEGLIRIVVGNRVIPGTLIVGGGRDAVVGLVNWVSFDFNDEDRDRFEDLDIPAALDISAEGYEWQSQAFSDDIRVSLLGDLSADE